MNADGTEQEMLAFGTHPVWSPDSTRVAYSSSHLTIAWLDDSADSVELASDGKTPAWVPATS